MHTSLSVERRRFTCGVCGKEVVIETRPIEKFIVVCLHEATRGGPLPVVQLREEGVLIRE